MGLALMKGGRTAQLPFWNAEFVGAGPYRVKSFTPGTSVVLSAFDGAVVSENIRLSRASGSDAHPTLTDHEELVELSRILPQEPVESGKLSGQL